MNNWLVTLVNTEQPFDTKRVVVHAETITEAFDEKVHKHPTYYPRSTQYVDKGTGKTRTDDIRSMVLWKVLGVVSN